MIHMSKQLLRESTVTPLAKAGKRWKAVLAVPGVGSSGTYSEDVLREFGPSALAPGAKAFVDHDPQRSPKDMIGIYPDGAVYEDGVGLVGELEVFPHWADFVEAVGPHAGLSIYMMGESDNEGNITALLPDRQNGVDLVSYPGLAGSGLAEKLYESAKQASVKAENGTATADRKTQSEGFSDMEIVELAAKVDALTESITALVGGFATLAESIKPIETVIEEESLASVAEAAIRAGLPEESRKVVYEAVKGGIKSEDAIAAQKALVESIKASLTAPVVTVGDGRVVESASTRFSLKKMVEVA